MIDDKLFIIDFINQRKLIGRSRVRKHVDRRHYLIAYMYYHLEVPETKISVIFNVTASSINHAKKNPYMMLHQKDSSFIENTRVLRSILPYDFPDPEKTKKDYRKFPAENIVIKIKNTPKVREWRKLHFSITKIVNELIESANI